MRQPLTFPECFDELEEWRDRLRGTVTPEAMIREIEDRIQRESDPRKLRILNVFLAKEHTAQGNEAAAAAIRENDSVLHIHRWHTAWHLANDDNKDADIIPVLEDMILNEKDQRNLHALRSLLASDYVDHGDFTAAEPLHLENFNTDPHEPMPLISLASQKFYSEKLPEEAMCIINRAVEVPLRSGTYRRLALGHQARIALHLQNYLLVENALRTLLQLTFTRGNVDIGVERDFLDHLPPGTIDPEVVRQYDEYCRQRGKEPGADSPKQTGPAEHS